MYQEQKHYYVYIMASGRNGTLYIGVTNDIARRTYEHKTHAIPGFTSKYNVDKLVYYEQFTEINDAIAHEKRLKRYHRNWKKDLIEKYNPDWRDLYDDLIMLG
ncbi:MAG: GIY-YIG nuclease family protein [Alphaproteobacteria bacterium]|nr:GIY-YIG nuclease family protein [Alphaproteobacteria bacterium]